MEAVEHCQLTYEYHPSYGRRVVTVTGQGGLYVPKKDVWLTGEERKVKLYIRYDGRAELEVYNPMYTKHPLRRVAEFHDRPDFLDLKSLVMKLLRMDLDVGHVSINREEMLLTLCGSVEMTADELALVDELMS